MSGDNLVIRVAKIIDSEGAWAVAHDGTGPEAKLIPYSTRQKYFQAVYEIKAIEILKMIGNESTAFIKAQLIENEKDGWRRLGVPIDDPALKEMADRIIKEKHGG